MACSTALCVVTSGRWRRAVKRARAAPLASRPGFSGACDRLLHRHHADSLCLYFPWFVSLKLNFRAALFINRHLSKHTRGSWRAHAQTHTTLLSWPACAQFSVYPGVSLWHNILQSLCETSWLTHSPGLWICHSAAQSVGAPRQGWYWWCPLWFLCSNFDTWWQRQVLTLYFHEKLEQEAWVDRLSHKIQHTDIVFNPECKLWGVTVRCDS